MAYGTLAILMIAAALAFSFAAGRWKPLTGRESSAQATTQ
jgi:hypothetical protein